MTYSNRIVSNIIVFFSIQIEFLMHCKKQFSIQIEKCMTYSNI